MSCYFNLGNIYIFKMYKNKSYLITICLLSFFLKADTNDLDDM